ncbi:ArsR/SmtB family transcription factor [Gordonia amicalis]|uniref:ArsR/SmtB family transcription factor n=1 Tax=Gordonia amicalis TaxID=89053 RepID=UPI0002A644DC|nr:metalloregulator ArsR/SmtB family transcription factor [Gordonia amicalis]MBA5848523.1 helix-turn-helix transcriptional regulator [Gordonia amicalis]MDV7172295.1 metalloregulator ArsR/SmtB family transcription factor [Gordonia amicalis]NKX78303.1 helix-turn-helix transcriptional regulator [Gordonia amicalis]UOG22087.1 metalloregulator ArsR/SmtB family transcription factor [Gordonia amicalis]GAC53244.1 putative ArsR family transcriptional regulator [Gordonia amicalis NBRC 100051 = JCM 11271]
MANSSVTLDEIFGALADPTRRAVVERLGRGPATVGELAGPFPMTLPSFMKHLKVLEESGLVMTKKTGRTRMCTLDRRRLRRLQTWLEHQRTVWSERTDRLEAFVTEPQETS